MRFLKITIAYHGANYAGWQVQTNGNTIQAEFESAWKATTGETTRAIASGRTDAGVHALGQVCSLSTNTTLDVNRLERALNAHLPNDIRVLDVGEAPTNFHAIRDAVAKTYQYQIQTGPTFDLFQQDKSWFFPRALDIALMQEAANFLVGQHDFASFQANGAATKTTTRTIFEFRIEDSGQGKTQWIVVSIRGDGFLYNMVRNIVGTLVEIGVGKQPPAWMRSVLEQRDRSFAGQTAPAHGLFLMNVEYDSF